MKFHLTPRFSKLKFKRIILTSTYLYPDIYSAISFKNYPMKTNDNSFPALLTTSFPLKNKSMNSNLTFTNFSEEISYKMQEISYLHGKTLYLHSFKNPISIKNNLTKEDFYFLLDNCTSKYVSGFNSTESINYDCYYIDSKDYPNYYSLSYDIKNNKYILTNYAIFEEFKDKYLDKVQLQSSSENITINWCIGLDQYGELDFKTSEMQDPKKIYDSFYPSIPEGIDTLIDSYIESEDSILLLKGSPGTGKTNLIKYIAKYTKEHILITYNDAIKDMDLLFSYFYDSPEKYLIIEDADTYIQSRQDGNTTMKKLLNITDGLTANKNKKIIFSTNLPSLSQVDAALLRPGRCHRIIEIDKLTREQYLLAAKDIGLDTILLTEKEYSLAELFEIKKHNKLLNKDINKITNTFGFGS